MELDERELVMLEALSRHEGWAVYRKLLEDYHETTAKALRQRICTPEEQARHNENMGRLSAIEKCHRVVEDIIKQK
jgi:hypothetical protein